MHKSKNQLGEFDRRQDAELIETGRIETGGLNLIDPRKNKPISIRDVKKAVMDGGKLGVEQGSREFPPLIMWKSREENQKMAVREVEKVA